MLTLNYTGYNTTHESDFIYDFPQGFDFHLLIFTISPAKIWVKGEIREYPPYTAVFYPPGQRIYYAANGGPYINDWVRFYTDEAFANDFPLKGIPITLSDPEYFRHLFQLLTWEFSFPSADSDMTILDIMRILFRKLKDSAADTESSPHAAELVGLRKEIYNSPQLPWNVGNMAEKLHLSEGYLQVLYKNMFGISCMDDVIANRIRFAKDQLANSHKSIGEIAELCGYNNVEHFCRQFRKLSGHTPSAYRRLYGFLNPRTHQTNL